MLCIVIKGPTIEEVNEQIKQAIPLADLLELRLDLFKEISLSQIKTLCTDLPIPVLFTLRSSSQGGLSCLNAQERISQLSLLAQLKPDYLDLQYPEDLCFISQIKGIKLLLSYHNCDKTPRDLQELYDRMQKSPAHFYKIAVKANGVLDTMHLLCWSKQHKKPNCIAISIGSAGQISRILSPVIENPITYACLDEDPSSSLGQLSAQRLITQYNMASLTPKTAMYGLIGDPVEQSISDITHNSFFQSRHLEALYLKIRTLPSELSTFLSFAKQLPFKGLSVTMPLKEAVMSSLDFIDDEAQRIGAVNTLLLKKEQWIGYNTDGKGALNAIEKRVKVKGKKVIILGAGGAAKAIAYEAEQRGALVTILTRNAKKAKSLAAVVNGLDQMHEYYNTGYDILINCTPADLPIDPQYLLPQALIMDIRSRPKKTPLLQHALKKNCAVVYGYEMFIEQALLQYQLFGLIPLISASDADFLEKVAIKTL